MDFDRTPIDLIDALKTWALVVVVFAAVCIFVAVCVSLLVSRLKGPGLVAEMLSRGIRDLFTQRPRRIGAMALLTFRESIRKKTLWIGAVFILLFMFGHWFLGGSSDASAAKRYIVFVMTAVKWLLIPVAVILSCWGLPNDIKERSLHTVVTKPTRRAEIVLGRILGYSGVITLALLVMSVAGYIWIQRTVPERAKNQLIARVPIYGELRFLTRTGTPSPKGINVGDIWEFRSFIEGMTSARAIYTFDNLEAYDLDQLKELRLEYNFEAFRTHKGVMGENVRFSFHFHNPSTGVDVKYPRSSAPIYEFAVDPEKKVLTIPRVLNNRNADIQLVGVGENSERKPPAEVDLFEDIIDNGKLQIRVSCDDSGQYLGMARPDLFFRLPDRPFAIAYIKAIVGLWMMLLVLIMLGTTASTFVKGPVSTLLVVTFLLIGQVMRGMMDEHLEQYFKEGRPLGGGTFESLYRIITQNNQISSLDDTPAIRFMQWVDSLIIEWMAAMKNIIPDFRQFDGIPYLANGFDVPWESLTLPSVLMTIGFLMPCLVVGTYSLMIRELEAK